MPRVADNELESFASWMASGTLLAGGGSVNKYFTKGAQISVINVSVGIILTNGVDKDGKVLCKTRSQPIASPTIVLSVYK